MRVGLIGCGRIGQVHAASLHEIDGVEAVVVTDADADRARIMAERYGWSVAPDADELLASGVDAVVVASSTDSHAEHVRAGVRAGVPVLCEKPLSGTPDAQIVREVEASEVLVQMGFQRRFDPGYQEARRRVRAGELGWLHTVRATTLDPAPPPAAYIAVSGGIFADCGVHDFDAVRWVCGTEVATVYATGANRGAEYFAAAGDVDTAAVTLVLEDGTLASVALTRYNAAGYDVRLDVLGSRDSIAVGLDDRTPLTSVEPGSTQPPARPWDTFLSRFAVAYRAEVEAFLAIVRTGGTSPCTVRDSLEAQYVAEAAGRSWREGRPVPMAEVRR